MAGNPPDKTKILIRLRKIEGQTRGLQHMLEENKSCLEILTQISSIKAALKQVSLLLIETQLSSSLSKLTLAQLENEEQEKSITEVLNLVRGYTELDPMESIVRIGGNSNPDLK